MEVNRYLFILLRDIEQLLRNVLLNEPKSLWNEQRVREPNSAVPGGAYRFCIPRTMRLPCGQRPPDSDWGSPDRLQSQNQQTLR